MKTIDEMKSLMKSLYDDGTIEDASEFQDYVVDELELEDDYFPLIEEEAWKRFGDDLNTLTSQYDIDEDDGAAEEFDDICHNARDELFDEAIGE